MGVGEVVDAVRVGKRVFSPIGRSRSISDRASSVSFTCQLIILRLMDVKIVNLPRHRGWIEVKLGTSHSNSVRYPKPSSGHWLAAPSTCRGSARYLSKLARDIPASPVPLRSFDTRPSPRASALPKLHSASRAAMGGPAETLRKRSGSRSPGLRGRGGG